MGDHELKHEHDHTHPAQTHTHQHTHDGDTHQHEHTHPAFTHQHEHIHNEGGEAYHTHGHEDHHS